MLRRMIWWASAATPPFRGKERIARAIARPRRSPLVTVRRGDVTWRLHGQDLNEFRIATRKNHSPVLFERLSAEIKAKQASVFWDVGANIGGVSLPILARHPNLLSVMFEPSAEVAGRLIGNVAANPALVARAQIMSLALTEKTGLVTFFPSAEEANSGVGGLAASGNRQRLGYSVQGYRGDEIVDLGLAPAPQVIKIDVEGFELSVLRGIRGILESTHPTVVFEHSVYRFAASGEDKASVVRYLSDVGYVVRRVDNDQIVGDADLERDTDFIARRSA